MSPQVNNRGIGEPKGFTGMVGTHHRPSDDLSTFGESTIRSFCLIGILTRAVHVAFLTPANAMLSVELGHLADVLDQAKQSRNISRLARQWSQTIHDAIWDTTVNCLQHSCILGFG